MQVMTVMVSEAPNVTPDSQHKTIPVRAKAVPPAGLPASGGGGQLGHAGLSTNPDSPGISPFLNAGSRRERMTRACSEPANQLGSTHWVESGPNPLSAYRKKMKGVCIGPQQTVFPALYRW